MPGTCVVCLLVMTGDYLGTTFVLLVIFLSLLWVIGTPGRVYAGVLILIGLAMLLMIVSAPYRFHRLTDFLHPQGNPVGQPTSRASRASGPSPPAACSGLVLARAWGCQWGWVPESTSDFIFAIIGEELGLVGTIVRDHAVRRAGIRRAAYRPPGARPVLPARGRRDHGVDRAAGGGQHRRGDRRALPITGVPLPLDSAGLSSLLVTMAALGMLMSFARMEPGAAEALAARGPGWPVPLWKMAGPKLARIRQGAGNYLDIEARRATGREKDVMRVLIAGGGSAGHISPALATADALSRPALPPITQVTCLGTERGLETRLIPLHGYPLELIPAVPLPRKVNAKLLTVPGLLPARSARPPPRSSTRPAPRCWSGSAGTPRMPPTWRRGGAGVSPSSCTQYNPRPGLANSSAPGSARTCSPVTRIPSSGTAGTSASRSGGRSPTWTGSGSATRPGRTSACGPTCRCCW